MIRQAAVPAALLLVLAGSAGAQQARSIDLILDASGSMNARLPGGGTRIDAARAAVADFVGGLDPALRIGFRVYGHRSPTRDHDCQDIERIVAFAPASTNRAPILAKTAAVKAQGYTPITEVVRAAAEALAGEPGGHVVVLVSDGKETCAGDPCAAARALAAADAALVIHTIGFNVDTAARMQLQCVARVARGSYSDAADAAELGARLGAAALKPLPAAQAPVAAARPKSGRLQITHPDVLGNKVSEAASGQAVGEFRGVVSGLDLPPGLYHVAFGPMLWKSIEVKAGETTLLEPGVLELATVGPLGNKLLDWETGAPLGEFRGVITRRSLVPSTFTVTFGEVEWAGIELGAGEHKVLRPAVIAVARPAPRGNKVFAEDGRLAGTLLGVISSLPVPPGRYTVEAEGGRRIPLELKEGERVQVELR